MGVYEETRKANERYAAGFKLGSLPAPPSRKLAVVACMDSRLTVEQLLGLKTGEAHVIRNAGGLVTDDALRSLIISSRLLGTRTVYVIEHTDCGMLTFTDDGLRERLEKETGQPAGHLHFHAFTDVESNLREQLRRIRENPFLPRDIDARGFVYHVGTGRLDEISEAQVTTRDGRVTKRAPASR